MTVPEPGRRPLFDAGAAAWLALLAVLACATGWAWHAALDTDHPEGVVRAYMEAILDRDVEAALALTDVNLMDDHDGSMEALERLAREWRGEQRFTESQAALLVPEAINDGWRVFAVTDTTHEYLTSDVARFYWEGRWTVEVVIGNDEGTVAFQLLVERQRDELVIVNGVVAVPFAAGPHLFIRTGTATVEFEPSFHGPVMAMFPGIYRFGDYTGHAGPPVAVVHEGRLSFDTVQTVHSPLTGTHHAEATRQVRALIDQCAASTERYQHPCPFGTFGTFDIDGVDVELLSRDLRWQAEAYPEVALAYVLNYGDWELRPVLTDPGYIRLTGWGRDASGATVAIDASCHFGVERLIAYFTATGELQIRWQPSHYYDVEATVGVRTDTCEGAVPRNDR